MEVYLPPKNGLKLLNTSYSHRENTKKDTQDRKRCLLHLIHKYLSENRLFSAAETLQTEAQLSGQYEICENIDLEIILEEYQSYYNTKFQKQPKILRKLSDSELKSTTKKSQQVSANREKQTTNNTLKKQTDSETAPIGPKLEFQFDIHTLNSGDNNSIHKLETEKAKFLCDFENYSQEWRESAEQILKQIIPRDLGVKFHDCIGLDSTIETLKEAIIYPLQFRELFEKIDPWGGILLYGPPGTGKTLLARALACESTTTVINVTSSAFISKWRGESEKMLKTLFDVAKIYSPATIFIDELDSLCSTSEGAHEASRRFRSELLIQIDGVLKNRDEKSRIFILAATNNPWNLPPALLRRFEKRILVPLPDKISRGLMFKRFLENQKKDSLPKEDFHRIIVETENYSGSDIKNVCKEAEMILIREKLAELRNCSAKKICNTRCLNGADIFKALHKIRPSSDTSSGVKYREWGEKYGAF